MEVPMGYFTKIPMEVLLKIASLLDIKCLSNLLAANEDIAAHCLHLVKLPRLVHVIQQIDIDSLMNLLIVGIEPNITDSEGNTLLAIAMKRSETVEENVPQNGEEPAKDKPRQSDKLPELIALLLLCDADPKLPNRYNRLPLDFASLEILKNRELCAALYEEGARVTDLATFGRIYECQSVLEIQKLLANGTDIAGLRGGFYKDMTILHHLANDNNNKVGLPEKQPVLDLLLKHAPGLLDMPMEVGRTPLHLAVQSSNKTLFSYLLEKGADPEAFSSLHMTPLNCAVPIGALEIVIEMLTKVDRMRRTSAPQLYKSKYDTPFSLALHCCELKSRTIIRLKSRGICSSMIEHKWIITAKRKSKKIRSRPIPRKHRDDFEAILRISQGQVTESSHRV
ncbi:ankyrin repeat-containing domain protein [Aspergillus minisclerotigenes]|uniref:Ankyrin repeat-containing domain protein n=1 Tax=Aspergillus minisclerotigenes TaxID=656917 RepID=A0A5N6JE97_9EURO|nr:ankyrin repeat-containing domain protein [Aspergillus minisclerotigenes]